MISNPGQGNNFKEELYSDSVEYAASLSLIYAAANLFFGFSSYETISEYLPEVSLLDNVIPRILFISIPCVILSIFLRKSQKSQSLKLQIWVVCYVLLTAACSCIYIWPIAMRDPTILLYYSAINSVIYTLVPFILLLPRGHVALYIACFSLFFWAPILYMSYPEDILFREQLNVYMTFTLWIWIIYKFQFGLLFKKQVDKFRSDCIKNMFISSRVERRISLAEDFGDWNEDTEGFILVLDLRGFTQFSKDPDNTITCKVLLRRLNSIVRKTVHRHGGEVHKSIGDGFLCYFVDDDNKDPLTANLISDSTVRSHRSFQLLNAQRAFISIYEQFQREKKSYDIGSLDICGGLDFGEISFQIHGDSEFESIEYDISGQVIARANRIEEYTKYLRQGARVSYLLISCEAYNFYCPSTFSRDDKAEEVSTSPSPIRNYPEIEKVYSIRLEEDRETSEAESEPEIKIMSL